MNSIVELGDNHVSQMAILIPHTHIKDLMDKDYEKWKGKKTDRQDAFFSMFATFYIFSG